MADIALVSAGFTPPTTGAVGVAFTVSGNVTLRNLGPNAPVLADVTFMVSVPPDCVTSPLMPDVVQDRNLPLNQNVFIGRSWLVTCTLAGPHDLGLTVSAVPDPVQGFVDPDTSNNSLSLSGMTQVN